MFSSTALLRCNPLRQHSHLHPQRRTYLLLHTALNPPKEPPRLPSALPSPPKTIILLTTPSHASTTITKAALTPLNHNGTASVLAAAVDSLPGARNTKTRTQGHSWLITDHRLRIKTPKSVESLTLTLPTTTLTIPLANTLFHTGHDTTSLHLPSANIAVDVEAAPEVSPEEVTEFVEAREEIRETWEELGDLMTSIGRRTGLASAPPPNTIEVVVPTEAISGRVHTHIPLTPLTPPRQIDSCMGNILRTLEGGVPASRELESVVVDSRHGPVFARVTAQKPAEGPAELLLMPGTRIHRVLSGGGGWGKKAGLLSLDPQGEPDVGDFARMFEARFEGENNDEMGPGGMVVDGEWVQFFAAGEPGTGVDEGIRLGAVGKEDVVAVEDEDEAPRTLEGVFGGYSEGGVDVGVAGKRRRMDVPGGVVVVDV